MVPAIGAQRRGPFERELSGALGAWEWDGDRQLLFGDARFATLYGIDPAQAQAGLPTSAFFAPIHPQDLMRIRIAVAGVLHGAEVFEKDYRLLGPDGSVRWVSAQGRGEHDAGGKLLRFKGVLVDVTQQKHVEEQLRIAQTAGGVGTFEYIDGFGTANVSDQFCRLLGLHPADTLPVRTINGLVHPDDPLLIGPLGKAVAGPVASEHRVRRADDAHERWIAVRGEHREDGLGAGLRFIGVIYDITEAKEREARLRQLADELEARVAARTQERDRLWRISRDLIAVVDEGGRHRAVNAAWERLLGWSEDELVGRPAMEFAHPDDLPSLVGALEALRRGEALEAIELRVRGKDGAYRWIDWSVVPADGEAYATGRDITERRQLEDQLRQSQKMEAVGQLTGGLAHDLNNMLTGVLGGMDLLKRRIASGRLAEADRFIEAAAASAERAAALTHRLLAFSRRQSLDTRAVDVNALVGSMEDMLRRTLTEQIDLRVVYGETPVLATTDANQLESAILNLAINARDAMPAGGKLTIEIAEVEVGASGIREAEGLDAGSYVVLSVSDTGSGMPQSVIDKAFDPFFTTKPVGQGTGLGLSMVYGFMRQTGGHASIYSEEGRGTSVKLYLPLAESAPGAALKPGPRRETPLGSGETVLLVEDDPSVRMLVREVLDELGYAALEAVDADAALAIFSTAGRIDLLITDVGLPGMNGRQLAEMVRARRPEMPVLFITGYAPNAAVRGDFLGAGMDMITKPFPMDALARKIREMVGQVAV